MSHVLKEVLKNISIDCAVFGFENSSLEVLLIKRARNPFKNSWALPGGFIKKKELVEKAAERILQDSTGIKNLYMEEVSVFDSIYRFPNRRVITIAYFALISPEKYKLTTGVDTTDVKWIKLNEIPELPFDHNQIINVALSKLRTRVRYRPIGFELLPNKFTLPRLQMLYEVILDKKLDKRNFRKKIMKMHLLKSLKEKDKNNLKRAAALYQFDKQTYNKLKKDGFNFEI